MKSSHCCFAGCKPMPCGCCFNHGWHEEDCEESPLAKLKEIIEDTEEDHK